MKKILSTIALFVASSACAQHQQVLSYLTPDAAGPGMAIYTELIGPNVPGNFGVDGLNNVDIELINPLDVARLAVGPRVTSWDGRMVSVLMMVLPDVDPGPVPFRVVTSNGKSNVDTFYIVAPQVLSENLPPGELGSGGIYGTRSRRNTLVVESLHLGTGTYTVSTNDPDPLTPGNQAFLPLTIISKGDVHIEGTLSLDGVGKNAVAGGGGGGACYTVGKVEPDRNIGGNGFTAAGGMHGAGGMGSGGEADGWNGGASLNGTPGGGGLGDRWWDDQGGGGGTGFPFGTASRPGTWFQEGGNSPAGGIGGGSGGGERSAPDSSFGGGGGAFATNGGNSGLGGPNGGQAYGNCLIVPFCGGSGGGGGNQFGYGYAGRGGAGGGAVHIISLGKIDISGSISAKGADGESTNGSAGPYGFGCAGGGGGAGGAIAMTAPLIDVDGSLIVDGGKGGAAVHQYAGGGSDGGDGGIGRIRIIGASVKGIPALSSYSGPALTTFERVGEVSRISGTGRPGDSLLIFPEALGKWNYDAPLKTRVGTDGKWQTTCSSGLSACTHISILEELSVQNSTPFLKEPHWVMSPQMDVPQQSLSVPMLIQSPATLSIIASSTESSDLIRVQVAGQPLSVIQLRLSDVLGRVVYQVSTHLDAFGRVDQRLVNPKLANGVYFVTASDATSSVSKSICATK